MKNDVMTLDPAGQARLKAAIAVLREQCRKNYEAYLLEKKQGKVYEEDPEELAEVCAWLNSLE